MAHGVNGNCVRCGIWRRSLHRDHIIPKFKGGPDEPSNIQLLCANCHEDKTVEDLKGHKLREDQKKRQADAQRGKKCSETRRLNIAVAHYNKIREDAEYAKRLREMPNRNGRYDWKCVECGLKSLPGAVARHQSATGHVGRERVDRDIQVH